MPHVEFKSLETGEILKVEYCASHEKSPVEIDSMNARTAIKTKVLREKNKRSVVILIATSQNWKQKWNILEIRIMW